MIKKILKRREECATYLTHVCRHCWSRKSPMKIDEIADAARGETGSKGGGGPVKLSDVYTRELARFQN